MTSSASQYWRDAEERRFTSLSDQPHLLKTERLAVARANIASEIDAVALLMCSLRSRYNATVPVNRLPPEIVAHIFDLAQEHWLPCIPIRNTALDGF
ncbi:hypothetical protein EVG20_g4201 [Dentipellis fragilis]|uniref:Uncharacterized protein n=1 Tax=Dentipellis fragilis TaxID=205917 RepID=A0A4Y9YXB5_9AGAM|nr:hypothetical protein EVG20_g4201 [Dentipellis fragilis]